MKGALLPGTDPGPPHGRFDPEAFYTERRAELVAFFQWATARLPRLDAEDIFHDAWEVFSDEYVHGRIDTSDPARLVAWFKLVGRRRIVDELRVGYLSFESPHPSLAVVSSSDSNQAIDPEQQWADRADLMRHITAMPAELAEPFLYDDAGYSRKEIAKVLDITPAAVGMRLMRARSYLRRRLGVVAAFLPASAVLRSARRAMARPSQVLVTTIGSLSVVVAFGAPIVPAEIALPAATTHGAVVQIPLSTAEPTAPGGNDPTSRSGATTPSVARAAHRSSGPAKHLPVPHVPSACAAQVCVGACPGKAETGDRIYLKPVGDCDVQVTEAKTPVCQHVPDNPVVGCEREGKPQWTVDPPPPPSPLGAPQ